MLDPLECSVAALGCGDTDALLVSLDLLELQGAGIQSTEGLPVFTGGPSCVSDASPETAIHTSPGRRFLCVRLRQNAGS